MQNRSSAFRQGIRAQLPTLIGTLPFAFMTGAASTAAGMDPWLAMGMSIIVYAGASQLAAISLMVQGAPILVVIATVFIVNLRMSMYSAALAPLFRHLPLHRRLGLAYGITDHNFALMQARFPQGRASAGAGLAEPYFTGMATTMWVSWQAGVAMGVFAGTKIPKAWSLEFAIPLIFAAILFPALLTRTHWIAAGVAAVAAAFTTAMPMKLGLIAAAISAMAIGALIDARAQKAGTP